MSHTKSF